MPTHWSERLAVYETDEETVAQFRQRCNVLDEAPVFTPFSGFIIGPNKEPRLVQSTTTLWDSLTSWEKAAERHFTPAYFRYRERWHGPSSIDFGNIVADYDNDLFPIFTPTNHHDCEGCYLYEQQLNDRYAINMFHSCSAEGYHYLPDLYLESLESNWLTSKEEYYRARLLTPSTNNGYYFFY